MKKSFLIFLFSFIFSQNLESKNIFIAYEQPKGRLGDQLFCYCKAKWISYKYNIPLYYKPFKYAEELVLSVVENIYEKSRLKYLQQKRLKGFHLNSDYVYIDSNFNDEKTLYIIDQCFYSKIWKQFVTQIKTKVIQPYDILYDKNFTEIGINNHKARHDETIMAFKQDAEFIKELKKLIKPIKKLAVVKIPKDIITVAVHVRIGGGFDGPQKSPYFYNFKPPKSERYLDFVTGNKMMQYYEVQRRIRDQECEKIPFDYKIFRQQYEDIVYPLKHAPMQFYVDQIKGLSVMLRDFPLFIYIFTDQPDSSEIKKKFEQLINKKNITFACRERGNYHNLNVLEDLFSMSQFDCLIRPYSSLSQTAELIGDHKIVISPYHSIWYEGKLIIDEVLISIHDNSFITKLWKREK